MPTPHTHPAGTHTSTKFLNDYFAANPTFAVHQGKHEYDGKFPDWSDDGTQKEIARLKAEREKATAFKDADLDDRQKFERDYLIAQIDKDLFWQETADYPHTNPNWYSDAARPGRLCFASVCSARAADQSRTRRMPRIVPGRTRADQRHAQNADAKESDHDRSPDDRRPRGFLCEGCRQGLRAGQGRAVSKGF